MSSKPWPPPLHNPVTWEPGNRHARALLDTLHASGSRLWWELVNDPSLNGRVWTLAMSSCPEATELAEFLLSPKHRLMTYDLMRGFMESLTYRGSDEFAMGVVLTIGQYYVDSEGSLRYLWPKHLCSILWRSTNPFVAAMAQRLYDGGDF